MIFLVTTPLEPDTLSRIEDHRSRAGGPVPGEVGEVGDWVEMLTIGDGDGLIK